MSDCEHPDFTATLSVNRLCDGTERVRNFIADITVKCAACGVPFHFVGVDAGLSFIRPMGNVGATELHAPIAPGEAPMPTRLQFEVPGGQRS